MAADTVDYSNIKHESVYARDGTRSQVVTYTFFIGKHGPFIERVPDDANADQEINARIARLKTRLATLPR